MWRPAVLLVVAGCSDYAIDPSKGSGGSTSGTSTPVTTDTGTWTGTWTVDTGTVVTETGGTDTPTETTGTPPDPTPTDDPLDPGLDGGHFDVDTSSFLAAVDAGSTDAHVHQYDDRYDVVGVNAMAFLDAALHDLDEDLTDPDQRFKLLVLNGDLSPGARITVDDVYVPGDPRTWTDAEIYDDTALAALPIWSLGGSRGSTRLSNLGVFFDPDAILTGDLVPTQTGCVQRNTLSLDGGWRNGALTLQAVAVNADGTDAFTTDRSLSVGGVQGGATSGLLWEMTLFWHWSGPCADDPGWSTWQP